MDQNVKFVKIINFNISHIMSRVYESMFTLIKFLLSNKISDNENSPPNQLKHVQS